MFKQKYKRSEWFEGLLFAESAAQYLSNPKDHIFVADRDGFTGYEILWRNYAHEKPWLVKIADREFGQGVIDYLEVIEETRRI